MGKRVDAAREAAAAKEREMREYYEPIISELKQQLQEKDAAIQVLQEQAQAQSDKDREVQVLKQQLQQQHGQLQLALELKQKYAEDAQKSASELQALREQLQEAQSKLQDQQSNTTQSETVLVPLDGASEDSVTSIDSETNKDTPGKPSAPLAMGVPVGVGLTDGNPFDVSDSCSNSGSNAAPKSVPVQQHSCAADDNPSEDTDRHKVLIQQLEEHITDPFIHHMIGNRPVSDLSDEELSSIEMLGIDFDALSSTE